MSDDEAKYLEAFSQWLSSLGTDAEALSKVLSASAAAPGAREAVAGGLNYLFKSLDLIPDGIDDIGYLDDAFVLRVAASMARDAGELGEAAESVGTLAQDAALVQEFLGESHERLVTYVDGLRGGAARGRTVDDILSDSSALDDFLADVAGFHRDYEPPRFNKDPKNLIKLRAFFDAKLPK